jgi:hypothetical protein
MTKPIDPQLQRTLNIAKKNILIPLIRKVSVLHGGDDPVWLDEFITETLKNWAHDLDAAIVCFQDVLNQPTRMSTDAHKETNNQEIPESLGKPLQHEV